jgi:hypothetical protein
MLLTSVLQGQSSGRPPAPAPPPGSPLSAPVAKNAAAPPAAASEFPEESLPYLINWPSGLSLGEAVLSSGRIKSADGEERFQMRLRLNVAIPGFIVMDEFRSETTAGYCSLVFDKSLSHGKKKTSEKIAFDQAKKTAERQTNGGGKSEIEVSPCAKDALAFLYYARRELKQGRIPSPQSVYYGSPYQVRLEYSGTQSLQMGDTKVEADKVTGTVKGPASSVKFEAYFARDAVRTPLQIRLPLPVGVLSMELSR